MGRFGTYWFELTDKIGTRTAPCEKEMSERI